MGVNNSFRFSHESWNRRNLWKTHATKRGAWNRCMVHRHIRLTVKRTSKITTSEDNKNNKITLKTWIGDHMEWLFVVLYFCVKVKKKEKKGWSGFYVCRDPREEEKER